MPTITLKDIPEDIHARLVREEEANHRSLTGEALRRLEMSFDLETARNSARDTAWIKDAIASGPEEPLTREKYREAVQSGLKRAARKGRMA